MTPTNIKEEVKAKIIKANEDLLKLSFGCEVKENPAFGSGFRNCTFNGRKIFTATVQDNCKNWMFPIDGGFARVKEDELIKWHKIIGHPRRSIKQTKLQCARNNRRLY